MGADATAAELVELISARQLDLKLQRGEISISA
jgi:hypothetical protein